MLRVTLVAIFLVAQCLAEDECGSCDPDKCVVPPVDCPAGLKKDLCNCCFVCARTEGERCSLTPVRGSVVCADDLECRSRDDLHITDKPEAICYCRETEPVCGNDGRNYDNICSLHEERYRDRNSGLDLASRGPCPTPPVIIAEPEDVASNIGSNVVLTCEASGNPVPSIVWEFRKYGQKSQQLPSDDQHLAVQSRGGPRQYEVTSWLQLREIVPEDDGDYICIALNSWGQTKSSAKVTVIGKSGYPTKKYNKNLV